VREGLASSRRRASRSPSGAWSVCRRLQRNAERLPSRAAELTGNGFAVSERGPWTSIRAIPAFIFARTVVVFHDLKDDRNGPLLRVRIDDGQVSAPLFRRFSDDELPARLFAQ